MQRKSTSGDFAPRSEESKGTVHALAESTSETLSCTPTSQFLQRHRFDWLVSTSVDIVISKFVKRYFRAKRTSLFTSTATNQSGVFQEGGQEKLKSDFQNTRRGQSSC